MSFLSFITSLQLALANPIGLKQHMGRFQTERSLRVLVVLTPGWGRHEYKELLDELAHYGFEVWTQEFPIHTQRSEKMKEILAQSMRKWPKETTLMIGHGFAGSVMAEAVAEEKLRPKAMALLGVPLSHRCSPALKSLLKMEDTINDPAQILYGNFSPRNTSVEWTVELKEWCTTSKEIHLEKISIPIWTAASGLDNIAPPENVRPMIGENPFLRVGPLSFHREEPDHWQLLHHKETLKSLWKWSHKQLRKDP